MAINDQPDAKYLLACGINCKGEQLTPIKSFSGEINGNGYKIHNFSILETDTAAGFIITNNGIVKNLSLEDFTYNVNSSINSSKSYGVVCAINNGAIHNCHTYSAELNISDSSTLSGLKWTYIGSITGENYGEIIGCNGEAKINVTKSVTYQTGVISCVGGIVGKNWASISRCSFNSAINMQTYSTACSDERIGCLAGEQSQTGKIELCNTSGDIIFTVLYNSGQCHAYTGGFIGNNEGEICASYSSDNISMEPDENFTQDIEIMVLGGFAGVNAGKINCCYSTTNINSSINKTLNLVVGCFVGRDERGGPEINKCFSTGSINLATTPTSSGYFVGISTNSEIDCYYLDIAKINVITKTNTTEGQTSETIETIECIIPSCAVGEAKTYEELTSVDFIENALYFDRMVWLVVEGQLPTLR